MKRQRCRPTCPRRAFTLIEILVVITIIAVLVGLTVAAAVGLTARQQISNAENTLKVLGTALKEWEASSDRSIGWGENGVPVPDAIYEVQRVIADNSENIHGMEVFVISELLDTFNRTTDVRDIIARIDADDLYQYNSGATLPGWITEVQQRNAVLNIWGVNHGPADLLPPALAPLDPWGTPILAIHPGRMADNYVFGDNLALADEDGTVRTWVEIYHGVARDGRICFVSAGPDGQFGNFLPPDHDFFKPGLEDNIYSYEVIHP